MSDSVKNLVSAIAVGNAMETEQAFSATMAEKISARLDDMRVTIAQSMFKQEQQDAEPVPETVESEE